MDSWNKLRRYFPTFSATRLKKYEMLIPVCSSSNCVCQYIILWRKSFIIFFERWDSLHLLIIIIIILQSNLDPVSCLFNNTQHLSPVFSWKAYYDCYHWHILPRCNFDTLYSILGWWWGSYARKNLYIFFFLKCSIYSIHTLIHSFIRSMNTTNIYI